MTCGCEHDKTNHNHGTDFCNIVDCVCYEFIPNVLEWKEAKARWDYENTVEDKIWADIFHEEEANRKDMENSRSTDLGNPGGITFWE